MIDFSKYTLQELRAISEVMDDLISKAVELESWKFVLYVRSTARAAFRAESAAIDQQAAEQAPAAKVQLSSLYGTCVSAEPACDPPAEDPAGLRDMQSLVDGLRWCAARLAALADAEDEHFAECSRMEVCNKVILLRNCNSAVIEMLADISDHYNGLH